MFKLSHAARSFMKIQMCIDLDDLENRITHDLSAEQVSDVCILIEKFYSHLDAGGSHSDICAEFMEFSESSDIKSSWYGVADPLRHAFELFASGGLHQLFTYQENDDWYPKVVLVGVLHPNDINSLPAVVKIYRGCDIDELSSSRFGQSWTTSRKIAEEFAFEKYMDRPWFQRGSRAVLSAKIAKPYILFSQQYREFEIALDPRHLTEVEKVI